MGVGGTEFAATSETEREWGQEEGADQRWIYLEANKAQASGAFPQWRLFQSLDKDHSSVFTQP